MAEDKTMLLVVLGLIAVTIIFGGLGRLPVLSGYGTQVAGTMNVTIQGTLSIILIDDTTNFGTGYVDPSQAAAYVDSNGTYVNWINTTEFIADPMVLQNDGQVVANVSIKSSKDASGFIGGTSAAQKFYSAENETSSCATGLITAHTDMLTTDTTLCDKLLYIDASDELKIYYDLAIPNDAPQGNKTSTITFTATSSV